jgi:hypothetical protein
VVHFDITRVIMRNVAKGGKHVFVMEVLMMYLRFNLIFFFWFLFLFCFVLLVS